MDFYAGLFESMMACCGRAGLRQGPVYTLTMLALGLLVTMNLLSVIQLLWTLGVLDNPYRIDGNLHSQRFILGMLYLAFLANTVLARLKFSADRRRPRRTGVRPASAPAYVLASMFLFVLTLCICLRLPA